MEKELSYDQFIAFLLIYTSHADYDFGEEEKEYIKTKVDSVIYEEMYAYFLEQSEYGALQVILNHKSKFYNLPEKKKQILGMIKENFYSDGDYSKLEKNLLNFLDHLL